MDGAAVPPAVLELTPSTARHRRKTPLRGPPDEHPGVRAALDSLFEHRRRLGLTGKLTARRPASAADVDLLERPLREMGLTDGTGALDWTAWPVVVARMHEAIRREAGSDDPKRVERVKTSQYFHLAHLSRPDNFRRYWDRDELDRRLVFDGAAPPSTPPRARAAPGPRGSYRPGAFAAGESDMEDGT